MSPRRGRPRQAGAAAAARQAISRPHHRGGGGEREIVKTSFTHRTTLECCHRIGVCQAAPLTAQQGSTGAAPHSGRRWDEPARLAAFPARPGLRLGARRARGHRRFLLCARANTRAGARPRTGRAVHGRRQSNRPAPVSWFSWCRPTRGTARRSSSSEATGRSAATSSSVCWPAVRCRSRSPSSHGDRPPRRCPPRHRGRLLRRIRRRGDQPRHRALHVLPLLLLVIALGRPQRSDSRALPRTASSSPAVLALSIVIGLFCWFYPARVVRRSSCRFVSRSSSRPRTWSEHETAA